MPRTLLVTAFLLCLTAFLPADDKKPEASVPAALNFTVKSLDGKDVPLSQYQGKVVMIVNVASRCGATPSTKPLRA